MALGQRALNEKARFLQLDDRIDLVAEVEFVLGHLTVLAELVQARRLRSRYVPRSVTFNNCELAVVRLHHMKCIDSCC